MHSNMKALVFLAMVVVTPTTSSISELKIGCFNIQNIGRAKMGIDANGNDDPSKMDENDAVFFSDGTNKTKRLVLVDIIQQYDYDILAILEVSDIHNVAMPKLKELINNSDYEMLISDRLNNDEQYAWLYKPAKVSVVSDVSYDATGYSRRGPHSVRFVASWGQHFRVFTHHNSPDSTTRNTFTIDDIRALSSLVENVTQQENIPTIVMGDLNWGCSYISTFESQCLLGQNDESECGNITSIALKDFISLIDYDADTTVRTTTHCAYDRIFISKSMEKYYIQNSTKIDNFKQDFHLRDVQSALEISDHFPVHFHIKFPRYPFRRCGCCCT
eukprot:m.343718 g.343718  ORF g.343718 m.343718 type:complete len:330 (+) comp23207_c0_seq1:161-1150(+)